MAIGADLTDELVEKIISHFPVKMAIRAALVSSRFIESWKFCRNLCFDINKQLLPQNTFAGVIDRVMSQHSGPKIERLVLKIDPTGYENQVNEWIQMAVTKQVEHLELDFFGGIQKFQISSNLIGVESIRVLKLDFCSFQRGMKFNKWRFLKMLHFKNIHLTISFLGSIFRNCLVLEDLELVDCQFGHGIEIFAEKLKYFKSLRVLHFEEIRSICINIPTLESLYYSGAVCSFSFVSSLHKLNDVTFNFAPNKRFQHIPQVEHLVRSLRYCNKLNLCSKILEGLSPKFKEYEYVEVSFSFRRLKNLILFLGGTNNVERGTTFVNPCDIICFLKNCPVINKIFIDLGDYSFEEGLYWNLDAKERFEKCSLSFQFLKNLIVKGFKYQNLEFQLVKKIVENAQNLEDVILIKDITRKPTLASEKFQDWMRVQRCNFNVCEDPEN